MIELTVCAVCWRMSLTVVPSARVAAATRRATAAGSPLALAKTTFGPRVVRHALRGSARFATMNESLRRRRELLDDADDVERHDAEAAARAVEHAQLAAGRRAAASSR